MAKGAVFEKSRDSLLEIMHVFNQEFHSDYPFERVKKKKKKREEERNFERELKRSNR